MMRFFPSTQPNSRSACRNASPADPNPRPPARRPTRAALFGCCASAEKAVIRRIVVSSRTRNFVFTAFSHCCLLPDAYCLLSLDHSIRPRQHIRRNREPNLLGGFEVDDQFEFRGLLDW